MSPGSARRVDIRASPPKTAVRIWSHWRIPPSLRASEPPRVAEAPCGLECRLLRILTLDDLAGRPTDCHVVFGQVIGVHIDDHFIKDGLLDTAAMQPIARCGYDEYAAVESVFSMARPAT